MFFEVILNNFVRSHNPILQHAFKLLHTLTFEIFSYKNSKSFFAHSKAFFNSLSPLYPPPQPSRLQPSSSFQPSPSTLFFFTFPFPPPPQPSPFNPSPNLFSPNLLPSTSLQPARPPRRPYGRQPVKAPSPPKDEPVKIMADLQDLV